MTNVVSLEAVSGSRALQRRAKDIKNRLWNPPRGRSSSELDITGSAAELRRRQEEQRKQREAWNAEAEELRRELLLDAGMRNTLEEYALVRRIAEAIQQEETREPPKIRAIIEYVAEKYRVTPLSILSARKPQALVRPRFVAMYLAQTLTFKSLPQIGREIGGRDHTTVLNGIRRVKEWMSQDAAFKEQVEGYQRALANSGV